MKPVIKYIRLLSTIMLPYTNTNSSYNNKKMFYAHNATPKTNLYKFGGFLVLSSQPHRNLSNILEDVIFLSHYFMV